MEHIFWDDKLKIYKHNNHLYLIDFMFLYVNKGNISSQKIDIHQLLPQLSRNVWNGISPMQIIEKTVPTEKKDISIEHAERIKKTDIQYPIIINTNYDIIDGMHRLVKAYLLEQEYIEAYIFNDDLMDKFMIWKIKGKNWIKTGEIYYDSLSKEEIEELYRNRFPS